MNIVNNFKTLKNVKGVAVTLLCMFVMWVVNTFICRSHTLMCSTKGENFVDSGIKILIAVVIGALLLGGLYALFGDTILPTLTEKVEEMFNFAG